MSGTGQSPGEHGHRHPTASLQGRVLDLAAARAYPKTICPSEVARALSPAELDGVGAPDWRGAMEPVREAAQGLREQGKLEFLQRGEVLDATVGLQDIRGPIRLRVVRDQSD